MIEDVLSYFINFYQGQFHKAFGHPMDAVRSEDKHQPGMCRVIFTCKECGRSFPKQICTFAGSLSILPHPGHRK